MAAEAVSDVLVIGGGLIGLSIAWHLLRADHSVRVTVVEREPVRHDGTPGQASPAAAGMLAPLAEANAPGLFVRLGLESLRRYPAFLGELQAESSSFDVHLTGPGMLRIAVTPEDWARLRAAAAWQRSSGEDRLELCELSSDEVRAREPNVTDRVCGGLLSPAEVQLEPQRLLQALRTACERQTPRFQWVNGTIAEITRSGNGNVSGVRTAAGGALHCGALVVAGGAWSAALGKMLETPLPIAPVRGQILSLRPSGSSPVRHTIYHTGSGYVVPRRDNSVVVGATEEPDAEWDARVTARGLTDMLAVGCALVPELADASFLSARVGLRPATPDHLPVLGPLPGWHNVYAATGHFRNGVLLTPITGHLLAQTLLRPRQSEPLLDPFLPNRFPTENAAS